MARRSRGGSATPLALASASDRHISEEPRDMTSARSGTRCQVRRRAGFERGISVACVTARRQRRRRHRRVACAGWAVEAVADHAAHTGMPVAAGPEDVSEPVTVSCPANPLREQGRPHGDHLSFLRRDRSRSLECGGTRQPDPVEYRAGWPSSRSGQGCSSRRARFAAATTRASCAARPDCCGATVRCACAPAVRTGSSPAACTPPTWC